MYLKSLELQGFKSFPDRTKLSFEEGATVIVGPNGSGKSNISDAMRWVLGEISSKNLRGTKMEDIIFGGADSRRPMGYAEVSVTFDNTDVGGGHLDSPYDEVTVTRRYYKAGESEYFINRKPVRLKDIYELFMNTGIGRDGYSIIGQGKIAEIVSRKSEERRSIFEDASGIAKFRHKKSAAEQKLSQTEDNMVRITDILSELEGRVEPLEKESAKAKKYLELYETKKKADVQLWLFDTDKIREDVSKAENDFNMSEFELRTVEDSLAALEAQNDKLFDASQSNKHESEQLLTQIREQTQVNFTLDSDFKIAENDIVHINEMISVGEIGIEDGKKNAENELLEKEEKNAKILELGKFVLDLKKQQEDKVKVQSEKSEKAGALEEAISTALVDIKNLESDLMDVKVRISVIENAKTTDKDKYSSILTEIEEYSKVSKELEKKCELARASVDKYVAEIDAIDLKVGKENDKMSALSAEREAARTELGRLKVSRDTLVQKIDTLKRMEEHFEGYNNSVRFVMKQYEIGAIKGVGGVKCGKIYGPLSKLISVDKNYITAIETALGANLQNIVVQDEETAKSAMLALKNAGAGRATFYPITSMRSSSVSQEIKDSARFTGYVGTADSLVKHDDKFGEIVRSLLGRTVIFDNIDNASAMAKSLNYRVKTVTLDGQQINPGGSFTGGSSKRDSGILSRSDEIDKLIAELEVSKKALEKAESNFSKADQALKDVDGEIFSLENNRKLMLTMMNAESSEYDRQKAKLDSNNSLIEKLRGDYDALSVAEKQYADDLGVLCERENSLTKQINEINEFRAEKEVERNILIDEKNALGEEITELYIKISEAQKDIDTERTLLVAVDEKISAINLEIEQIRSKNEELLRSLEAIKISQNENRAKAQECERTLAALNAERAEKEAGSFEFEKKLTEIRGKIKEKTNEKELAFRNHTTNENKLAQIRAEQEKLSMRLWDEYELTRNAALELGYPMLDADSRKQALTCQTECKNKLRALGSVNVGAIEEYTEVKTRYDYMTGQVKDLTAAKNDLCDIISKLEQEMKTAFVDSFNKINKNFNLTFAELFGGGSAELQLTDPEDVLNCGIEIKAAPPGKIIKSMMQLSGGEQAFVAIALFFAILQVNPTPFCILDEIEAALDEVNVTRFGEYIKRYSSQTQFILITHRRGTMEVADRLYGVTMPERGISKVLTLNIADIQKTEGDDWDGIFGQA